MKHIIKVQSLSNLPETRPLIAMDGSYNLKWLAQEPEPEWVDLGLSVKWAKYNLGATSETEYGNYYAWGELETKDDYSWAAYTRHTNGTYSDFNKKVFIKYVKTSNENKYWAGDGNADNKLILDSIDDAAAYVLGENWKMPSKEEFDELLDTTKITNQWITKNEINGVEFTSLINGNKLFIPANGYYNGSSLLGENSICQIWTSSLSSVKSDFGSCFYFSSSEHAYYNNERSYGCGVRPVYDPS